MTTIHAAAASHLVRRLAFAALATVFAAGLGACSSDTNILGNAGDGSQLLSQQTVQPAPTSSQIAIAPVIGAPESVGKQIVAQLTQDLEQKKVAVAKAPTDRADFTLRGYIVAAKEKNGTKVSYIWDVTDPTGQRVNRITGEEVAGKTDSRDPWAAVTPEVMHSITSKTATSLGTWIQSATAVAGSGQTAQPVQTAALGSSTAAQASSAPVAPPAATASISNSGTVTAVVPSVTGAPGDGSVSLTRALQRELSRNGVALAEGPAGNAYRVEGRVKMGASQNGKQPIQIDWYVKDPQGKQLGTVSQKNEIPAGSLDGEWGKVADAAASAAAQGILKLLPGKGVN
ncbi:MAG TPA: hypothetical protein VF226_12895 [Hyphomicrobiaceae bacterium]